MTSMSRIMSVFPIVHLLAIVTAAWSFIAEPDVFEFFILVLAVYGLPLAVFRVHQILYPLKEGSYDLSGDHYIPWWGVFNCQKLFMWMPVLEQPLHVHPSLFSAWLRLWGSTVGKGITYSPGLVILDRSLLHIGDGVFFGYEAKMTSHGVTPNVKGYRLFLYVRRVFFGDGSFIGAQTAIAPGTTVDDGAMLGLGQRTQVNQRVSREEPTSGTPAASQQAAVVLSNEMDAMGKRITH